MRSASVWFFAAGFLCLTATPSVSYTAANATPGAARAQLSAFSQGVKVLRGAFSQTLFDANARKKDASSGAVALMAPRQFRWDVNQPFEQHIVADGNAIWVYDVDLEQVTVRAQSFDEANSPLAVLLDLAMLDVEFSVSERPLKDGQRWLRLVAKAKNPDFKYAELGFQNNQLSTMRLIDNFGQRTEIAFSGWQRNPVVAPGYFTFTPPKGVDVVGKAPESAVIQKIPN
jgi:outer membrane lipoprotein carrier protein